MSNTQVAAKAEMLIRRPVEQVFAAFVDPAITSKFWFSRGSSKLDTGKTVTWHWEMYGFSVEATVKTLEPNKRIVVAWTAYGATTDVEWVFTARPDGTTFVTITNAGFEGSLEDIFDLQDQVAASVVGTVAPRLEQAEIVRSKRKPTESLDAYDCFQRAMAHYHLFTRDSMVEARRLFRRATDLDPGYAAAYGFGSWCVSVCQANGWLAEREREIRDGVTLAQRAVAVGMDDPIALVTGGAALATLAGELDKAIAYVDRAIVLNPNLALAWSVSGWGRAYLGEHADAIVRLERAMRLSPFDLLAHHFCTGLGWAHLFAGRYDEAVSWARKAALEKPDWAPTVRVETIACALSGRIVEAQEALARMRALDPNLRLSNAGGKNWRRAEDRALYIEGLRLAGLPE